MVGTMERHVLRGLMVFVLVALSMLGVPAVLSSARPNRERQDVSAVLVVGEDLARLR